MKQIIPQKIDFYAKDKDGKNYITKNNNPYFKSKITTATETIYVNVFTPEQKELLKVGQAVELEIEKNGQYTNYSFPRKKSPQDIKMDELEIRVKKLEDMIVALGMPQINYDAEMIKADKQFNPTVENQEVDESELPF